jgi:hypothetical protein
MTSTFRFAVRPAPPGAAAPCAVLCAALLVASLVALAGCAPDRAAVDRSPVAGMAGERPGAGDGEDGPRADRSHHGTLALTGGAAYEGPAAVECGPAPPRTGRPTERQEVAIGRVEPGAGEGPVAQEPGEGEAAHGEARFDVTLTTPGATGLAVTLYLPAEGTSLRVPALVATVADDGTYRESAGTAEVHLEKASTLTRSAATAHVSGRFTGSYRGDAGNGELAGRFDRCAYFD